MSPLSRRLQSMRGPDGQLGAARPSLVHIALGRHRQPVRRHRDCHVALPPDRVQISHVQPGRRRPVHRHPPAADRRRGRLFHRGLLQFGHRLARG